MKKFNEYLLGGNSNLIGTIIAFRKGLVKSKYLEYEDTKINDLKSKHYTPESYSVLLYFDHRIGQITRYIFNPNLIFWGRKPNLLNIYTKESNYMNPGEADAIMYNVPGRDAHSPEMWPIDKDYKASYGYNEEGLPRDMVPTIFIDNTLNKLDESNIALNFKLLFDGKISKNMIGLFLHQLLSNYILIGGKVTPYYDMEYLFTHISSLPEENRVPFINTRGMGKELYIILNLVT